MARLQLFFSTHDVTLSGWRLRDFLRLLRDGKVAAVKTGPAPLRRSAPRCSLRRQHQNHARCQRTRDLIMIVVNTRPTIPNEPQNIVIQMTPAVMRLRMPRLISRVATNNAQMDPKIAVAKHRINRGNRKALTSRKKKPLETPRMAVRNAPPVTYLLITLIGASRRWFRSSRFKTVSCAPQFGHFKCRSMCVSSTCSSSTVRKAKPQSGQRTWERGFVIKTVAASIHCAWLLIGRRES